MRQKFLALIALSALAHAQTAQVTSTTKSPTQAGSSESDSFGLSQPPREEGAGSSRQAAAEAFTTLPKVSFYERHDSVRREREEELVVAPCLPNKLHRCLLDKVVSKRELRLESLQIEPTPGFTVRYRQDDKSRDTPAGAPVLTGKGLQVFRLKIRADRTVPIGASALQGRLKYQIRGLGGQMEEHEVDLVMPLNVVDRDASVVEARWSLDNKTHPHARGVLIAVLTPILLPLELLLFAAWAIACESDPDNCV